MISPCVGICELEGDHCMGCGRSLTQIKNWSKYTDNKRQKIMEQKIKDWLEENGFYHENRDLLIKKYPNNGPKITVDCHHQYAALSYRDYELLTELESLSDVKKFITLGEQFVVNEVNYET